MILQYHNERHSYGRDKHFTFELKCDLDLGDINVILLSDTPFNDGEQMFQMILKSNEK